MKRIGNRNLGYDFVTISLRFRYDFYVLLFLCALSFLRFPSRVLDTDLCPRFPCNLFRFAFLRREPLVLPFVCALVEGQLPLSHMHSFARLCMLSSHTLPLFLSLVLPFVCALVEAFTSPLSFDSHPQRD